MKHSVIGIDLAKNIFQICALNENNEVMLNRKVKRAQLLDTLRQFESTLVVMETCYSSNHWGREILKLGHQVKLIPAFRVKPFVVGNKNDANDALAICEAALRPNMKFVSVKTLEQQDIQTVYRIRERQMKNRVALINQLRGLLSEYGFVFAKSPKPFKKALPELLEDDDNQLTTIARTMVCQLYEQWNHIDSTLEELNELLLNLVKQHQDYSLLMSIPGIGPIVSALIMAHVTDANQFKNGRQMAAWIGLTPRQFASGEISRLSGISKRGNADLRRMLIHGARTVLNWCQRKEDALSLWLRKLIAQKHPCKVIVALANKMARMIWAVLTTRKPFDMKLAALHR